MGTNYLGHFALTCLLGDRIKDRVISVLSSAYAMSRLHLDDLNWDNRKYSKWGGTYLAPRFSQWGKPKVTQLRGKARDAIMARRLWDASVELTGCGWPV
jgi:hypothetical protein